MKLIGQGIVVKADEDELKAGFPKVYVQMQIRSALTAEIEGDAIISLTNLKDEGYPVNKLYEKQCEVFLRIEGDHPDTLTTKDALESMSKEELVQHAFYDEVYSLSLKEREARYSRMFHAANNSIDSAKKTIIQNMEASRDKETLKKVLEILESKDL